MATTAARVSSALLSTGTSAATPPNWWYATAAAAIASAAALSQERLVVTALCLTQHASSPLCYLPLSSLPLVSPSASQVFTRRVWRGRGRCVTNR